MLVVVVVLVVVVGMSQSGGTVPPVQVTVKENFKLNKSNTFVLWLVERKSLFLLNLENFKGENFIPKKGVICYYTSEAVCGRGDGLPRHPLTTECPFPSGYVC